LTCRAEKPVLAIEDRIPRKTRNNCASIHSIAETYETLFSYKGTKRSENLIFSSEIAEFTSQKNVVAALPSNACFDLLA
jgi:hypothetical protein